MTPAWLTALISAGAALIGSFGIFLLQARHQRRMAHEDRLWSRRAETYVELLQHQDAGTTKGKYSGGTITFGREVLGGLTAKTTAFASNAVRELWQESSASSIQLSDYVAEIWPEWGVLEPDQIEDLEKKMGEDPEFQRLSKAADVAGRNLADRIRTELHGAGDTLNH